MNTTTRSGMIAVTKELMDAIESKKPISGFLITTKEQEQLLRTFGYEPAVESNMWIKNIAVAAQEHINDVQQQKWRKI